MSTEYFLRIFRDLDDLFFDELKLRTSKEAQELNLNINLQDLYSIVDNIAQKEKHKSRTYTEQSLKQYQNMGLELAEQPV